MAIVGYCHNRPSEAHRFDFAGSKLRFRLRLSLAWRKSTICRLLWRIARPHISATRLFVHFHSTNPTIPQIHKSTIPQIHKPTNPTIPQIHKSHKSRHPIKKKEHSLLVLPSVDTIINFANKFFDMLTKKQSEHPQKVFQVFQVFRVFQVFHFAFGPQNSPVLVQIRTNPAKRRGGPGAISWLRETPKKAIHPLVGSHPHLPALPHTILSCKL